MRAVESSELRGEPVQPDIPNHTIHRRIGRGSYGDVWLAVDAMGKLRAVKVVSRRDATGTDRGYGREFKAIKQYEEISHSHGSLMPILNVGRDPMDRFFYYSMELADDIHTHASMTASPSASEDFATVVKTYEPRTLRAELRLQGRYSADECIQHGISLATALEQLHIRDLIHRDIKPDNIIFVHGCPKLADVGLVADAEATYSLAGTVAYLSPEQTRGKPADVFALGKVLYEMVTGREAAEFPAPPSDLGEWSVGERKKFNELNEVILTSCQPEVRHRYPSARHLREHLEMLKKGDSVLRLRELEEQDRRRRRLFRIVIWTSAIFGCAAFLLLLGYYFWTINQRATTEARRSLLREVQISRMQVRRLGWFSNYWGRLQSAAKIRDDLEVRQQASGLLDGWDARPVKILRDQAALSAAFGPDGRVLIGGAETSPVVLIETNGATTVRPMQGSGPVCWTSNGVPLQLVAASNGLVLREALSGQITLQFWLDDAVPSVSAFNPVLALAADGSMVAMSHLGRLVVWKAEAPTPIAETRIHATALAFSNDGSVIGAGTEDGTTHVYAVPGLAEVAILSPALRGNPISCLAFGRDPVVRYGSESGTNSLLLAAGDQGTGIVIWDLAKRLPRSFCRGSTWTLGALAFSPDGLTLASVGRNEPRLWDVSSGQLLLLLSKASWGTSLAVAFDRTGRRLLTGGLAGEGHAITVLWELERHRGIQALRGLASPIRKVWFSGNSERIAALSDDWHLAVWDVALNRLLFIFETPVGASADSAAGCFGADGEQLAFATGRQARLYHLETGQVLREWALNEGSSDQLQFDARGRLLLLRREKTLDQQDGIWRLHELGTAPGSVLLHEQTDKKWPAEGMALSPSGERFLVMIRGLESPAKILHVYDVENGQELWKTVTERTQSNLHVCFDPSGSQFAYEAEIRSGGAGLRLFRSSDFKEIGTTARGYETIGPSGKVFARNGWFFPNATGEKHAVPLATDWLGLGWVSAFSPNGEFLTWGTEQGVVLVADIKEVRRRLATLGR